MYAVKISEPVWQAIASRGKFGESVDDVLRRVFDLPPRTGAPENTEAPSGPHGSKGRHYSAPGPTFATERVSSHVSNGVLYVAFPGDRESSWKLPPKTDKTSLRQVRAKAV